MGTKIFMLGIPRGLPRGEDITDDFHVVRVLDCKPTKSAPRGCITFIAQEGGFRNVSVDDIVEVVGTIGGSVPRQTTRDKKLEEREERRAMRRQRRKPRGEEIEEPTPKRRKLRRSRRRKS